MRNFELINLKHKEMSNVSNYSQATPESAWAQIQKSNRFLTEKLAETDRILTEKHAETERFLNEKFAETDRQMKETALQMKETDKRMKEMQKELSGVGHSQGSFAEEYFFNSFEKEEKNFFGKKFGDIEKKCKRTLKRFKRRV
jgi:hypothetical protein